MLRKLKARLGRWLAPKGQSQAWFPLGVSIPNGRLEGLAVSSTGLFRLEGWAAREPPALQLYADGRALELLNVYRLRRNDLAPLLGQGRRYLGFALEWLSQGPRVGSVSVHLDGTELGSAHPGLEVQPPHYVNLFHHGEVLHRENIYGVGPPNPEADPEALSLARELPGRVLDFGCGSGALVRALRAEGRDAHGLELSRPAIVESLRDDVRPHVTLFEGGFPSPLEPFDSVFCSEVLEHIPDWRGAVAEIGRLCRRAAVLTVPDMSAVPAAFPHHVVPWHLLEATHVNFFTQRSLAVVLNAVFPRVSFARMGDFELNGTRLYTSLVAFCECQA